MLYILFSYLFAYDQPVTKPIENVVLQAQNKRFTLAKAGIPCSSRAGGVGSIPSNSDAQNAPSFRCWRFEMKLSPFCSLHF